jgi:hypothetical protein
MTSLPGGLALAVLLLGCQADELETAQIEQGLGCTKYVCGENSPICGGFPFFELDQTGVTPAPDSGLRIKSFSKGIVPLQVRVIGARLTGRTPWGGTIQHGALAGAVLQVENAAGVGFQIRIDTVTVPSVQPYWELGDDGTLLESYGMSVKPVLGGDGRWQNLCPIAAPSSDPMWSMPPYDALIFRGDRYDVDSGTVIATGADVGPWFNIACAGDVLSKVAVNRLIQAAQAPGFMSSAAQRGTAINMFRAAYCGGDSYTELGVPLDWGFVGGWLVLDEDAHPANVEAIWKDGKAVCLNNPRLIAIEDIDELPCDLPPCSPPQIDNWQAHGDFITINP